LKYVEASWSCLKCERIKIILKEIGRRWKWVEFVKDWNFLLVLDEIDWSELKWVEIDWSWLKYVKVGWNCLKCKTVEIILKGIGRSW